MTMDRNERLSAYLDGALDDADTRLLEAELAADPALARELAELKAADEAMRAVFAGTRQGAAPDRLLALLGDAQAPPVIDIVTARARRDRVRAMPQWFDWRAGGAIAASLVAALVVASQVFGPSGSHSDAAQVALNAVLDQTPSGRTVQLADGRTVAPRLSFADRNGRFCREFAQDADLGVACRGAQGWRIEAVAKGAAAPRDGEQGYATAGGQDDALDPAFARLGVGDPLNPAAEAALIARKWSGRR